MWLFISYFFYNLLDYIAGYGYLYIHRIWLVGTDFNI